MPRYIKSKQLELNTRILSNVINVYTSYFQKILGCYPSNSYKQKKWTKDHHKFIPSSDVEAIISCLRFTREHVTAKIREKESKCSHWYHGLKFLDCGCGVGNIMLLAKAMGGYQTTGLEYEAEVYEIAKMLVPDSKIIQQDILTFEHYADYDVIYYYQPIMERSKMECFAKKVRDDAKVGAVILTYNSGSVLLHKDGRFKAFLENSKTIPANICRMAHEKVRE